VAAGSQRSSALPGSRSDQRRHRSDSYVGIRADGDGVALVLDLSRRPGVRCDLGGLTLWTCPRAGFRASEHVQQAQRRKGTVGADVGDTAQENVSTTGRHTQRIDVVDTPRGLKRIGVVPTSEQRRMGCRGPPAIRVYRRAVYVRAIKGSMYRASIHDRDGAAGEAGQTRSPYFPYGLRVGLGRRLPSRRLPVAGRAARSGCGT
jgi:hypothetical protein